MLEVRYKGLRIEPTLAATRELLKYNKDMTDVLEILNKGYNCGASRRKSDIVEKCVRKDNKEIVGGIIEAIIGVFLIVGFLTQLVALISVVILFIHIIAKIKKKEFLTDGVNYYLILLFISLALLLTGAGFIAFDLPL